MRHIHGIVIHHSATDDGPDVLDFNAIMRWHVEHNKWSDIGYHAVAEYVDNIPILIFGRPVQLYGAHTRGYNGHLGLCFVGDFNKLAPPGILVTEAIKRVLVPWCLTHNLSADAVRGHSELPGTATDCPGHAFDMDQLRKELESCLTK